MQDHPSEQEGLQLMLAFFSIAEADKRAEVVALAERLATASRAQNCVSHYIAVPARRGKKLS